MTNNILFIGKRKIRNLGFFGLGISNHALCRFIKTNYPEVRLTLRLDGDVPPAKTDLFDAVYIGKNAFDRIFEDALVLSPSVRWDRAEIQKAKDSGVIITSEADFFFERYGGESFLISGSDGKSTTTTLTSLFLKERYHDALAVGNIGTPLTEGLSAAAVAAELSSFQLMDVFPKSRRATITNITPNHLNWHKDFSEYRAAKENILKNAAERVFNCDCPVSCEMLKKYSAFALYSTRLSEERLRSTCNAEVYISKEDGYIVANGQRLIALSKIKLGGEHNIKNLMAAIGLTFGLVSRAHIEHVANSFGGLGHRNEFVGCYGGVEYYNSSIDSSPTRTVTTLESHGEGLTLILGGRSKGLDYSALAPAIEKKVKSVIVAGENREEILSAIGDCGARIYCCDSLFEAVKCAADVTERGGTVLLSPASTSFDAFKNFEQRGEAFIKTVKEIFSK